MQCKIILMWSQDGKEFLRLRFRLVNLLWPARHHIARWKRTRHLSGLTKVLFWWQQFVFVVECLQRCNCVGVPMLWRRKCLDNFRKSINIKNSTAIALTQKRRNKNEKLSRTPGPSCKLWATKRPTFQSCDWGQAEQLIVLNITWRQVGLSRGYVDYSVQINATWFFRRDLSNL